MKHRMHHQDEKRSGQAALIALLVLTIATTVGLSLISRSTTDVSVTTNIEESSRAFSAAEAGVEQALRSTVGSAGVIDEKLGIRYSVSVASISATSAIPFVFPRKTVGENTETIWLVNHNGDGTLAEVPTYTANAIDLCWSNESVTPAVVVTVLYKTSGGTYQIAKGAYDPDAGRAATNKFSSPTDTTNGCGVGTNTKYKETITFGAGGIFSTINPSIDTLIALRFRPVYSDASFVVRPAQDLAYQGNHIESVGQTTTGINRKIVVFEQYRAPSSLFDAAVYSEGSFAHQ